MDHKVVAGGPAGPWTALRVLRIPGARAGGQGQPLRQGGGAAQGGRGALVPPKPELHQVELRETPALQLPHHRPLGLDSPETGH